MPDAPAATEAATWPLVTLLESGAYSWSGLLAEPRGRDALSDDARRGLTPLYPRPTISHSPLSVSGRIWSSLRSR